MNAQGQQSGSECPSPIDLSAWHDGEESAEIAAHVNGCAVCREMVAFYAATDVALKAAVQPSPELTARIEAACRRLEKEPVRFAWSATLMRAAALFALVAALSSIVVMFATKNGTPGGLARLEAVEEEAEAASENVSNQSLQNAPMARTIYYNRASDNFPLARIRAGNADADLPALIMQKLMSQSERPTMLPYSVHHVWVVDDLEASRQHFLKTLPEGASAVYTTPKERALCFRISLSDQQLQGLVNRLEGDGWALVTPSLPQPGQTDKLLLTGKEIHYIADIVGR